MSIYNELNVIDAFEEKFGNQAAVRRTTDMIVSYLSTITKPLPEIAAQGLDVAIRFRSDRATLDELEIARQKIIHYLRERSAMTDYKTPEYTAYHAVAGVLSCYKKPEWGGGASELVSSFWDLMEISQGDVELLRRLLKEYFPLEPCE